MRRGFGFKALVGWIKVREEEGKGLPGKLDQACSEFIRERDGFPSDDLDRA